MENNKKLFSQQSTSEKLPVEDVSDSDLEELGLVWEEEPPKPKVTNKVASKKESPSTQERVSKNDRRKYRKRKNTKERKEEGQI